MAEDQDQLIYCEDCCMWGEFEKTGLDCTFEEASREDFVFVCQKCTQLKELEALLAASDGEKDWVSVRAGRKSAGSAKEVLGDSVKLTNSFSGLPVEEVDVEKEEPNSDICSGLWEGEKVRGRALLIGDSIIRYSDREFCKKDKSKRVRVCLPGAQIEDISARVNQIVGDEEVVAVQVGTNNLCKDSQFLLRSKFKELISKLKSTRSRGVICGILPRFDRKVSLGKIADLNKWLQNECSLGGFKFVDTWAKFHNRRDLFSRDGLHLTGIGANELGRLVARAVDSELSN